MLKGKASPTFWAIMAVITAVVVTACVVGVTVTYWEVNRYEQEITSLTNRIARLSSEVQKLKLQKAAPAGQQAGLGDAEDDEYAGWLTYTNDDIGYTMRYQADWTVEERTDSGSGDPAKWVKFTSPNGTFFLAFGIRKNGTDTLISGRTGLGQGDLNQNGTVTVLNSAVPVVEHVYQGKIKVVFYGGAGSKFALDGHEATAEFDKASDSYDETDLAGVPERDIAGKILHSFKFK